MLCIIPARGGSTRLPNKNILELDGIPVIQHVIDIAYSAGFSVVVSTDSDEVKRIAENTGICRVSMRPEWLSGDKPESDVILYTMQEYTTYQACRIYPFAALLTKKRLLDGYQCFLEEGGTVMERTPYKHPILRAIKENQDYYDYGSVMSRSQDLPVYYHDAATYMFTTIEEIKKPLYERKIIWKDVENINCQDVDDAEDFEMLKMKYKWRSDG